MKFDLTKILIIIATLVIGGFGSTVSYIGWMILQNQEANTEEIEFVKFQLEALKGDMTLSDLVDLYADKDSLTDRDYYLIELAIKKGD